jgi:aldehyde dehydrogenase (NAD+)
MASRCAELVDAIPAELARTRADSYAAEVLPLLAACEFLEREAAEILAPRQLGSEGLPFWLGGIETVVERVPFGLVLVIGPANYPLFLPGVQALQALAAGNAVVWKPGRGGAGVAQAFARAMEAAGLPDGLLRVTEESVEAGLRELRAGVDKVFFTGSAQAGRELLQAAAQTATPVVAELSGCDAAIVLGSAESERVVLALKFGMRLNGSATCMAPRRLILVGDGLEGLIARLREEFAAMAPIPVSGWERLRGLLDDARSEGATVCGEAGPRMRPVLVLDGEPEMAIAQADVFAPVLTVLRVENAAEIARLDEACPFGLTAAVFGEEAEAKRIGAMLRAGTVMVNDLIVPTADPRVSFGGRRGSGFGVTRGREGLLEMTAVKTVAVRQGRSVRHYQETGANHEAMFQGVVAMSHGAGVRARWQGLKQMVAAAMRLR